MLVKTFGSAIQGIDAITITIEVNISKGSNFYLVGLPDNAVKESHHRLVAVINNINYKYPGRRIVINMAPADIKKEGSSYDLPITIALLAASNQLESDFLEDFIMMGELSMDGTLRSVRGALSMALSARKNGFKGIIVPSDNASEASVVKGVNVFGFKHITEVIEFLEGRTSGSLYKTDINDSLLKINNYVLDFLDVKGQENIKRAMEIAAAGGHNVIMIYIV